MLMVTRLGITYASWTQECFQLCFFGGCGCVTLCLPLYTGTQDNPNILDSYCDAASTHLHFGDQGNRDPGCLHVLYCLTNSF